MSANDGATDLPILFDDVTMTVGSVTLLDRVTLALASGAPIASVIFPAATLGGVIIPLVLFHQMQLMVAAALARRYADRPAPIAAQVAEPDL